MDHYICWIRTACQITIAHCILQGCDSSASPADALRLESKLAGHWQAPAFDGALHETWTRSPDGYMQQEGHYVENGDTSYSAVTRIVQVEGDLILFSVIRDANPKIFKAVALSDSVIVFENDDYRNPYRVRYAFLAPDRYNRTITGYERDSLVSYRFDFSRVE